jgi:hypothetical protein
MSTMSPAPCLRSGAVRLGYTAAYRRAAEVPVAIGSCSRSSTRWRRPTTTRKDPETIIERPILVYGVITTGPRGPSASSSERGSVAAGR